ncbi:hypothetical protein ACMCNP_06180 [Candidatus Acidulodesulfobacterium sp. H_13]|uniref:hypothetical protein n=1 Tax=Candidatus Acidulodesulfobacterium sp. H_13 TaxID=3395470 RepID=UPI003AF4F156
MDFNSYSGGNEAELKIIIEQLLLEARNVDEENFGKWYEKKRKIFNIGVKKAPAKEEFMKYLNCVLSSYLSGNTPYSI